jgi:predicted membrane-bound dolichyl-phosphate-mannose-protein mannosyltransferase
MKKKITILLIIIFFLQLLFRVYQYRDNYLSKFDAQYWKQRYLNSQWVVPNSRQSIGDDGLYAYAGWEYIHGQDPSLLNAEAPPFGKYMIGLSEIIFGNQNIFALLSGILVLAGLYILSKIIFRDTTLALIPVMLLSADTLFFSQLRAPFLDTIYLGLLILIFIFVLKEKFLLANLFLGLMAATKSSASIFLLVPAIIIAYLFYMKDYPQIKKFILFLPASILIFLLTYSRYFLLGHSFREFLGLQKWIITFYGTGAKGIPGAVWQIIAQGKWPTWWGTVEQVSEWSLLWLLSLIAAFYYFYKVFPRRRLYKSTLLGFWILAYLIFLTFVPVFPRYLLLVLPFMYILAVWVLSKIVL